jgi:hypothetical protein
MNSTSHEAVVMTEVWTSEWRTKVTSRKWLIVTGAPLAIMCLAMGVWFGGIYAASAIMGYQMLDRVLDLIEERTDDLR